MLKLNSMLQKNVSLKDYSNYKIGGQASYFLEVNSKNDLINGLEQWDKLNLNNKIFILGGGTNILISDKGFDGLVIHNNIKGIERHGENIVAGSGAYVLDINKFAVENSLSGLEWSGGLPGTIGGAVRGNAGAFGGETKDTVVEIESLNLITEEKKKRDNKQCNFDYRFSIFKSEANMEIILSVTLSLKTGSSAQVAKETKEKIDYRNEKHPMEYPNIGSTFKNINVNDVPLNLKEELMQYVKNDPFPVIPVAKLLYLSGVKGKREGDAQISEKHPNFIVNLGNAKYEDVVKLIAFAKEAVKEKFNIILEEEIMYLN
jgi:UDP-N-acetylmuramate dehydrogenase